MDRPTSTLTLLFFRGVILRFKTSNIDVEVKYKKAGNDLVVPKPPIRMRTFDDKLVQQVRVVADKRFQWHGKDLAVELKLIDPDTQKEVPNSEALEILEHYKYALIDEDGNTVDKEDIQHFAVQENDTEKPVSPFSRTSVIEVPKENWVPSTSLDGFLITSVYEIFSEKKPAARGLFEEAEKRTKADQIGITTFSWGRGFTQYYAFLCPLFKEGKYVWLMKLSDTKLAYNHLQDPPVKVKVPIREAPTLETLPPVQALVVTAKRKKK